jgi:hypothetical protein
MYSLDGAITIVIHSAAEIRTLAAFSGGGHQPEPFWLILGHFEVDVHDFCIF